MTEVTVKAKDGSGEFMAYVAEPVTDQTAPGVIVIQEIFGVNDVMRDICDNIAQQGYVVICPDLFWRQEPGIQLTDQTEEDWARAFELFEGFDVDAGVEDLDATLSFLRDHELCNGKVGDIGFCLGGKLAYLMATRTDADCSVSYYGVAIDADLGEAGNIKNPLLMHIAEKDRFVPKEAQDKIRETLAGNDLVEMHTYEGVDHAFARTGGEHYDDEAAHLANMRTANFLATCLTEEERASGSL